MYARGATATVTMTDLAGSATAPVATRLPQRRHRRHHHYRRLLRGSAGTRQ